jgi:hypothetical protein
METVYKFKLANRVLGILLGIILVIAGVVYFGASVQIGGGVDTADSDSADSTITGSTSGSATLIPLCGSGLLVLFGLFVAWGAIRSTNIHLTPDALELRTGKKVSGRYPYNDIQAVRMVARRQIAQRSQTSRARRAGTVQVRRPITLRYKIVPQIVVEGASEYPYSLDVPYKGKYILEDGTTQGGFSNKSGYDSQAVIRDLLSRLSSNTVVDPQVETFAQSGQVPDATTLPEEEVKLPPIFGLKQ